MASRGGGLERTQLGEQAFTHHEDRRGDAARVALADDGLGHARKRFGAFLDRRSSSSSTRHFAQISYGDDRVCLCGGVLRSLLSAHGERPANLA